MLGTPPIIFPTTQIFPVFPVTSSHPSSGNEIAPENRHICSRWNSWTGWIGALKYCKPITCLVGREERVSAAFFVLFYFFPFILEVSPVFLAVFLLLRLCQTRTGESRVTTGEPRFSPESLKANLRHFLYLVIFYFIFLALHHSLSWLDCTG